MQIKEYLFYYKVTQSEFADIVGVSRRTVVNLIHGKKKSIRSDVMRKIHEATNGKVTFEDMILESTGEAPVYPK